MDLRARKKLFAKQMRMTVKRLTDAGKTVALVYPIPETGYYYSTNVSENALGGR